MSFGPTSQTSQAMQGLGQNAQTGAGFASPLIGAGINAFSPAQNFFSRILQGNSADVASTLAPDINQIRAGNQGALQSASTLMPRGGGRSGTLFSLATNPASAITSLFNNARTSAATALPQIGSAETGAGLGLLNSSNQANLGLGNLGQTQQQISNSLASQFGNGLFNLLTTPLSALTGGLGGAIGKGLGGLFATPPFI